MSADEITRVPIEAHGELFAAMMYLAALAYPESRAERDEFIRAMKAHCLRLGRRHRRIGREAAAPAIGAMTPQRQAGRMRAGLRRVAHRLQIAEVALPSFVELLGSGCIAIKIRGSLTQRISELEIDRRETFRKWKAARPVLHLALAMRTACGDPRRVDVSLLHEPQWAPRALRLAEAYLEVLRRSPGLVGASAVRLIPNP